MKSLLTLIKKTFHPKRCYCCGTIIDEDDCLCEYCGSKLKRMDPLKRCLYCGQTKKNCQCKRRVFHFNGCVSPFLNTGVAKKVMFHFKFREKPYYSDFFAKPMAFCVKNEFRDIDFDAVCFVPTTRAKFLKRGYNQSEILAKEIAEILSLPVINLLKCNKNGKSQHMLSERERYENVKNLYSAFRNAKNKTLLLVDDIKTTGATLDECSKQLLLSGANTVYCVTALITEKNIKNTGNKK